MIQREIRRLSLPPNPSTKLENKGNNQKLQKDCSPQIPLLNREV